MTEPAETARLTAQGRRVVSEIYRMYEAGDSVEEIAERLDLEVNHIRFLAALDLETRERLRRF